MDTKAFLDSTAEAYAATLTEQQLTEIVAFYSSPPGIKLGEAHVIAGVQFQKEAGARLAESSKVANARFTKRIRELAEKSRREGQ